MTRTRAETTWLAALAGAVVVRLWNLGRLSLSMDEVWEIQIANAPFGDIHRIDDGFPPLFHYLIKPLIAVLGTDSVVRWVSAIAGLATMYVVYRIGNSIERSDHPRLGIIAATVMAWLPLHIHLSREGRVYSLAILLAALAVWGMWEIVSRSDPGNRSWVIYGSAVLIGMWLHYALGVVAVIGAVITLIHTNDRKRWLWVHTIVGVLTLPLLWPLIGDLAPHTDLVTARDPGIAEFGYVIKTLVFGFALGPSARALHTITTGEAIRQMLGWIIVLAPAIGYLAYHSWKGLTGLARRSLLWVIVAGTGLTTALIVVTEIGFQVRYFSWLMVPIALWLAAGMRDLHRGATLATVVCAIAMLVSIGSREFSAEHKTEDARAVAEFLDQQPSLPAFGLAWYMSNPVNYYMAPEAFLPLEDPAVTDNVLRARDKPGQAIRPLSNGISGFEPDANILRILDKGVAVGSDYYLVYSRPFHGDPDGSVLSTLRERDQLELAFESAGYQVFEGTRGT